ncbi:response regulator receiver domain protein [Nostoc carneum NIES-2107]|nr:response regulator receiver domain protein [Nostoc carneum NIES-2107]
MKSQKLEKRRAIIAVYEESYQALLAFILETEGWQVNEVGSATEVIEKLCTEPPDLLILDNRMPQLTKGEMYLPLLAHGIKLPIVLLTECVNLDKLALSLDIFHCLEQRFELPYSLKKIKLAYEHTLGLPV